MKTRVCRLYAQGDLRLEEAEVLEPGAGEVLVAVGAGGICGSDLHYYQDGGFGPIRVKEPIILGHEVAGTVKRLGPDVTGLAPGDRVALNPSQPCGRCRYCAEGLFNHCLEMRFLGSALRFPHEQGGFRDSIVLSASRCVKVSPSTGLAEAACSEPLAVCLHAAHRAGDLAGKSVLVTGAGPIGALCVAVSKHRGAAEIVVTDLHDQPLAVASRMGATRTANVATERDVLVGYEVDKGHFDVVFECSAAAPAIETAVRTARPRGVVVQVGVGGSIAVPINALVGKELSLVGSHRFHEEFAEAAHLIDSGAIDVKPIITHSFPPDALTKAFEVAADRSQSVKTQLAFS